MFDPWGTTQTQKQRNVVFVGGLYNIYTQTLKHTYFTHIISCKNNGEFKTKQAVAKLCQNELKLEIESVSAETYDIWCMEYGRM